MPYKDRKKQLKAQREWKIAHREQENENARTRYQENLEKEHARQRRYRKTHKTVLNARSKAYYHRDPKRWQQYRKEWTAANQDKVKNYHYRKQYGISLQEKQARIAQQNFRCAACETTEPGSRGWQTDHDHATKQLRGELCGNCNRALGLLADDPVKIENLLRYLLRYKNGLTEDASGGKSSSVLIAA